MTQWCACTSFSRGMDRTRAHQTGGPLNLSRPCWGVTFPPHCLWGCPLHSCCRWLQKSPSWLKSPETVQSVWVPFSLLSSHCFSLVFNINVLNFRCLFTNTKARKWLRYIDHRKAMSLSGLWRATSPGLKKLQPREVSAAAGSVERGSLPTLLWSPAPPLVGDLLPVPVVEHTGLGHPGGLTPKQNDFECPRQQGFLSCQEQAPGFKINANLWAGW